MPNTVSELISRLPSGAVSRASAVAPAASALPVPDVLRSALPSGGLRRGSVVEIGMAGPLAVDRVGLREPAEQDRYVEAIAPGGCSVLLLLLARVSKAGSWCALVNAPGVGLVAAAEAGVDLGRLALVPEPGRDWIRVVAALLDGFDLVAVRPSARLSPADSRWLAARVRRHGAVLVSLGPWSGADVRLWPVAARWAGLGVGHGLLSTHRMLIGVSGRGASAGRTVSVELELSGCPDGPRLFGGVPAVTANAVG